MLPNVSYALHISKVCVRAFSLMSHWFLYLPVRLLVLFGGLKLIFTECTDADFNESLPLLSLSGQLTLFGVFVTLFVSLATAVVFDVDVVDEFSPSSPVVCR